jgi:hypothetical protein
MRRTALLLLPLATASLLSSARADLRQTADVPSIRFQLVGNAGFENGTDGWSTPPGVSLQRADGGHWGPHAARVTSRDAGASCALGDHPNWVGTTDAGRYFARAWVRAGRVGDRARLVLREVAASDILGSAVSSVRLTRRWRSIQVAFKPVRPGASALDIRITTGSSHRGTCFFADDVDVSFWRRPPPIDGFPTRGEALARPNVVRLSGVWDQQYEDSHPAPDTTYDLRRFASTAYPFNALYAMNIGNSAAGSGEVTVGGTFVGQQPRDWTREHVYGTYQGDALRVQVTDPTASYDLRIDNNLDGYNPRVADGTEQDNDVPFLVEGAHMTYIRDDAVEDDDYMSGTIRDSLFDGVFVFLSAQNSASFTNTGQVVTIEDTVVRMRAMPSERSTDGTGHNKVFKWAYESAGTVVVRNCVFYFEDVPETDGVPSEDPNMYFPDGTYQDVTVVLGPHFEGDGDGKTNDLDYPVALPAGVTQTRDVSVFRVARNAWLMAHGYL